MASSVRGNLTVRYRLMANYRGAPYEAGIGPADGAVVLFAACPPPEELGFEPATGHWRKELSIQDVQAMWQSRPVGTFRGNSCIVLDDLGDRLHIGYLGHDAYRAEQLGYWQVDRGVFELVAPRDEVTNIIEERTDYQPAQATPAGYSPQPAPSAPARTAPAGYPAMPPQAEPGYGRPASPAGQARPDYLLSPAAPPPGRMAPPDNRMAPSDNGVAMPPPTATPPLPLEAEAMRAASAASRRDQAAAPAGLSSPAGLDSPGAGALPPSRTASAAGSMAPSAPVAPPASSGAPPLYAAPVSFAPSAPVHPGPQAPLPGAAGAPAMARDGESPRRRRSAGRRMATERIFGELASLAAIPVTSYSVGEEVDGAMCLLETGDGFEVFSSAGGARHEVRVFSDEESACFYLFGVLAADAVRTGGLVPSTGQGLPAASAGRPQR
jgi:hypothetical protein